MKEQAAMIIVNLILTQYFMVNVGLSEAATALIGNQIGRLNIDQAKRYAVIIFCESSAFGILVSVLLYLSRKQVTALFTDDDELAEISL